MIFLIIHATAVIVNAVDHQRMLPLGLVDPQWRLWYAFEIGRAQVELPTLVTVVCLKVCHRPYADEKKGLFGQDDRQP